MKPSSDTEFAHTGVIHGTHRKTLVLEGPQDLVLLPQGERILLGPDHDESLQQYHKIMAEPEQKRQPVKWGAVATILDDFLTWTEENRAAKTYTRYLDFIQSFVSTYGRMEAGELNPSHVTTWLATQKTWHSHHQAQRHHGPPAGIQLGRQEPRPGPQSDSRHGEAGGQTPHHDHHAGRIQRAAHLRPRRAVSRPLDRVL